MRQFSLLMATVVVSSIIGCGSGPSTPDDSLSRQNAPIINGRAATEAELFGTVALTDPMSFEPFCTGTLIAPTVVATAAHCVVVQDEQTDEVTREIPPAEIEVTAGSLMPVNALEEQVTRVTTVVRHAGFPGASNPKDDDGVGQEDDIALLILEAPVTDVAVVPILAPEDIDSVVVAGKPITITGYGNRDEQGTLSGELYLAETPLVRHNGNEYLAGGMGEPDSCQGDSGGPGYVDVGGTKFLLGTAARGIESAQSLCGEGGINTLVPAYAQWLVDNSSGAYAGPGAPVGGGGAGGSGSGGASTGGASSGGAAGSAPAPTSSGSDDDGGCAMAPGAPGGAPLVLLLGLPLIWRRRRG